MSWTRTLARARASFSLPPHRGPRAWRPPQPAAPQRHTRAPLTSASTTTSAQPRPARLSDPLNLPAWLSANGHLLQPPVNNFCVQRDPMTVMVVGGPNARTDYHVNPTPEFFYQYKGSMLLKTVDPATETFRDITIGEGSLFLLPANVPHNPVRFKDTVGVVIEWPRPKESLDRLRWYCQGCGELVHEASLYMEDLGTQLKAAIEEFEADTEARTCKSCGTLCDTRMWQEKEPRVT